MGDEAKHRHPPLDDVDAKNLACLSHEPFSSIHRIAQALDLAPATVHRHLTISLEMQARYFRWISDVLTREFRNQRGKGARALFDVIRQQKKTHFQDIITGDELWIFIDTAPSSIWLSLDEEPPTRPRRTICPDKRVLIAFWGIKGYEHGNWLPKDVRINTVYFWDETLIPIFQKLQTNVSAGHKPWLRVHMDNAKVNTAKVASNVVPNLTLKKTPEPPYSPDIYPSIHLTSSSWVG